MKHARGPVDESALPVAVAPRHRASLPAPAPVTLSAGAGGGGGGGRGAAARTALVVVAALAVGLTVGVNVGQRSVEPEAVAAAPRQQQTSDAPAAGLPQAPPSAPQTQAPAASATPPPTAVPLLPALPAADEQLPAPVSIAIPRLGIDQSLIQLGVNPDRTLEVPANGTDIGWWRSGPVPGEPGGAVIAAHVTWNGGQPAVFKALPTLAVGDEVFINRADGTVATYQVTATATYAKESFPNEQIYRLEGDPQLAIITCGGDFVGGRYKDNIVVFADLVADTRLNTAA